MGNQGDAGAVLVSVDVDITVSGKRSHGVFAQSGSGSSEGDKASDVTIDIAGKVAATGANGRGVLAQSVSANGPNNGAIAITVDASGSIQAASEAFETIALLDGKNKSIVNHGLISHAGIKADDYVVRTNGTASLAITNHGTLEGSIKSMTDGESGGAAIIIDNQADGTLGLGAKIDLGDPLVGRIENAGTMSATTVGTIGTSEISGGVRQTGTGTLHVDLDFGGDADLVKVGVGLVPTTLSGTVQPLPQNALPQSGNKGRFTIVKSDALLFAGGLSVADTATVNYGLKDVARTNSQVIVLTYAVDYTPWAGSAAAKAKVSPAVAERITANHTRFGRHVDTLVGLQRLDIASGANDLAFVDDLGFLLLKTEEVATLVDIYDSFAPAEVVGAANAALFASQRFAKHLNSCPQLGDDGAMSFAQEGSCAWARFGGLYRTQFANGLSTDIDESVFSMNAGVQMELSPGCFGGLAHVSQDRYRETGAGPFDLSVDRFSGTFVTLNPAVDVAATFDLAHMGGQVKLRAGLLSVLGDDDFRTDARLVGVGGVGPTFGISGTVNERFADLGAAIEVQLAPQATFEASFDTLLSGDGQTYAGGARLNINF